MTKKQQILVTIGIIVCPTIIITSILTFITPTKIQNFTNYGLGMPIDAGTGAGTRNK